MKIPILYLPRTFASGPSLSPLPDVVIDPHGPVFDHDNDQVKVVQIEATWKKDVKCCPPTVAVSAYNQA